MARARQYLHFLESQKALPYLKSAFRGLAGIVRTVYGLVPGPDRLLCAATSQLGSSLALLQLLPGGVEGVSLTYMHLRISSETTRFPCCSYP